MPIYTIRLRTRDGGTGFGDQVDIQDLPRRHPDADRRIGYLAKYMTKSMTEAADPASDTQRVHVDRLAAALAVGPCSPSHYIDHGDDVPQGER